MITKVFSSYVLALVFVVCAEWGVADVNSRDNAQPEIAQLVERLTQSVPEGWTVATKADHPYRGPDYRDSILPAVKTTQITLQPPGDSVPMRFWIYPLGHNVKRGSDRRPSLFVLRKNWKRNQKEVRYSFYWRYRRVDSVRPRNETFKKKSFRDSFLQTEVKEFDFASMKNLVRISGTLDRVSGRLNTGASSRRLHSRKGARKTASIAGIRLRVTKQTMWDGRTSTVQTPWLSTLREPTHLGRMVGAARTSGNAWRIAQVEVEYEALIYESKNIAQVIFEGVAGQMKKTGGKGTQVTIQTAVEQIQGKSYWRVTATVKRTPADALLARGYSLGMKIIARPTANGVDKPMPYLPLYRPKKYEMQNTGDKQIYTQWFPAHKGWKPGDPTQVEVQVAQNLTKVTGTGILVFAPLPPRTIAGYKENPNSKLTDEELRKLVFAINDGHHMPTEVAAAKKALLAEGKRGVEGLAKMLGGTSIYAGHAYSLLLEIGPPAVDSTAQAMFDGRGRGGGLPANLLGYIRDPLAIKPLVRALQLPEEPYPKGWKYHRNIVPPRYHTRRMQAAYSLGRLAATQAEDALLNALESKSIDVRCAAVKALGQIGSKKAIPVLYRIANNLEPQLDRIETDQQGTTALRTAARKAIREIRLFGPAKPNYRK